MSFSLKSRVVILLGLIISSLLLLVACYNLNKNFLIETPIAGGEIKEGLAGAPRFANPLLSVSDSDRDLTALIYNGLLRSDGRGQFIPDLAENFEISPDGTTYIITLKPNLTWHDGHPLTTSDIVYTIKLAQDPILKSTHRAEWEGVQLEVPNKQTIVFKLKQPFAGFLDNLTLGILPEHIWKNTDSANVAWNDKNINPIGSGPYQISSIDHDREGIPTAYHLIPFPKFALGVPKVLITLRIYPNEDQRVAAFKLGEINALGAIPGSEIKTISNQVNVNVFRGSQPRLFAIFFNQNEDPLLANTSLRGWLSQNIDRVDLIKKILNGFGEPLFGPLPQNNDAGLIKTLTPEALAKAGFEKNDKGELVKVTTKTTSAVVKGKKTNTTSRSEEKISFTISTSNAPELKQVADLVANMWRSLGAEVTVKVYEPAELNQNIIRPRKYEALLFGLNIDRDNDLFPFWHSSQRLDPGVNVAMYTNPKADKLLEEARSTIDFNSRSQKNDAIVKEITNDTPAAFLFKTSYTYALPSILQGVKLGTITTGAERFNNVHEWYEQTEFVWPMFVQK